MVVCMTKRSFTKWKIVFIYCSESLLSFKWNKDRIFLVFHVVTNLKPLLVSLWNFFKKYFDLISFSWQSGISVDMKGLVISIKSYGTIKLLSPWSLPFWNSLITLLMKRNELSAIINFSFYHRDFFVKVWWNSFSTIKIAIDCILFMVFWSLMMVILYFFGKRWIYRNHWCW